MSRVFVLINYTVVAVILVGPGQLLTWYPLMSLTVTTITFILHLMLLLGIERIIYERVRSSRTPD